VNKIKEKKYIMQDQTYKNYYFKINKKILQKLNTKQNIKKIVNSQKACKTRYLDHETGPVYVC
jgi:hypothetical protein